MDHRAWASEVSRILNLASEDPDGCVDGLRKLAKKCQNTRGTRQMMLHPWYRQQTLGVLAHVLSELGRHSAATQVLKVQMKECDGEFVYWRNARANASVELALEYSRAGNKKATVTIAKLALERASGLPYVHHDLQEVVGLLLEPGHAPGKLARKVRRSSK